jgi:hypothetical protein
MVPEFFALVHVGDVDLDGGKLHGGKGVPEGHRGVGEGARIDDDTRGVVPGGVDDVEQDAFVVGLDAFDREAVGLSCGRGQLLHVGQRRGAVFFRLAGSQQVQVWPIDHQDGAAGGRVCGGVSHG